MVHVANAEPSRLHSNVPASVEVNANVAEFEFEEAAGAEVIVVSGAVVSIVQVKLAGVGSTVAATSTARTWKVWLPSDSPANTRGVVHAANAAPPRLLCTVGGASFVVKVNVAPLDALYAGGVEVIVVSGAVRSTMVVV